MNKSDLSTHFTQLANLCIYAGLFHFHVKNLSDDLNVKYTKAKAIQPEQTCFFSSNCLSQHSTTSDMHYTGMWRSIASNADNRRNSHLPPAAGRAADTGAYGTPAALLSCYRQSSVQRKSLLELKDSTG